eukprot:GEMP01031811.1.p1 GENE.GEMP01031811.1~~GEMP01031811.1.p1  ORF type:complete len:220 (+),score=54.60 GEMP01031811.1:102-761(+)
MFNIFGKNDTKEVREENAKQQIRQWTRKMKGEVRGIEREVQKIEREEEKVKREIKAAAKQGNMKGAKLLAKEIVRSQKAKQRMYTTRAQLNSVQMELTNQVATMKLADSLKSSTDVMKHMSQLVNVPELRDTMRDLQKEMMKAGLVDEMVQDSLELMDDADMEEATEEEISKLLTDLAIEEISKVPTNPVAAPTAPPSAEVEAQVPEAEKELFDRLKAL